MEKGVGLWMRDAASEEWLRATVVQITSAPAAGQPQQVVVRLTDGPNARQDQTLTVDVTALENEQIDDLMLANSHDMDVVEDLIQLPHLHEPGICHTLNERFKINEIYTLTGEILLAINPFKPIGIYSETIMRKYIRNGDKRDVGQDVVDMPPHVFSIADKAFRSLMSPLTRAAVAASSHATSNQSILVSGESGAGKTESTKFVMQYLATIAQAHVGSDSKDTGVMKQVLSSNPILESFGNARTIRNDNSSRFGKFIKMQFSDRGQLIGASIQTYLLEKVRLAYQAESERNYHVFYELVAGASAEEKLRWHLEALQPGDFHYLNQSTCVRRQDNVDDAAQFVMLKAAMATMGFEATNVESIFTTIAMLLHLGNLEFEATHDASGTDGSTIDAAACEQSMQVVLDYLEVDQAGLEAAVCYRKIQAKHETYSIRLTPEAAENTRDALARLLYSKLFDWLVRQINAIVECDTRNTAFIGLLDIFGFEDLEHNSFEQLCINYANETLQQHFNRTVLRLEQETYEREQIAWSFINFPDNSACIELIHGRPFGILTALDEECIVPQGNDRNFSRKLLKQHAAHAHFSADKTQQANHHFVVKHYAGSVTYDSFGFCEKNKDVLYPELTALVKQSSKPFVRGLLQTGADNNDARRRSSAAAATAAARATNGGIVKGRAASTTNRGSLGSQFRSQLKELIETISVTNCHYVRCLKPNDSAAPAVFESKRICDQLKAGGVLEAVRVNRAGYPVRIAHQHFVKRYRPLANGAYLRQIPEAAGSDELFDSDARKQASSLLVEFLLAAHAERYPTSDKHEDTSVASVAGIQVGTTRVFFRRAAIQFVEAQLAKRYGEFVVLIQAAVRGLLARRHYTALQVATRIAQRLVRGFNARRRFSMLLQQKREREAALLREQQRAEALLAEEERHALEQARIDKQRRVAKELEEEEQRRLTAQSTASSSDPVSDDSSSEEATSPAAELAVLPTLENPLASRATTARGTSRFRFTRDYTDAHESRATMSTNGPRAVAMAPGDTVLHVAANCCNEHDVLKLLQNGSDINARNRQGRTPLHTASVYANVDVVGILLDWEADVVAVDDDGNTPLHVTTDARIAKLLLEAGCTPNIVNAEGRTPLIEAVERGDTAIVALLRQFKADVLFRELKHHQTALHLAVRRGHYAIVMELCKSDDIQQLIQLTDRNQNNALHFAVSRDRKNGYRLVDYLVKHGAAVDQVNARLQTPLVVHILTTRQTDPAITDLFVSKGSDPNVQLPDGATLLHVAVQRELIDIACALLRHGALLNTPNASGQLVLDVTPRKYLRKLLSAITQPPSWIDDKDRKHCMQCSNKFKFGSRRHHCRHCGCVCCSDCSSFTIEMHRFPKDFPGRVTSSNKMVKDPQRVCKTCYAVFKMRSAQKESKSGFMARVLGYEWDEVTPQ